MSTTELSGAVVPDIVSPAFKADPACAHLRAEQPVVRVSVPSVMGTSLALSLLGPGPATTSLRGLHREDQPHAGRRAQLRFGRVAHQAEIGLVQFGSVLAVLSGLRRAQAP